MPVSSIAQILLRLFALNWLLAGFIQIVNAMFMGLQGMLGSSLIFIVAGAITWFLAPALSRLIAKGNDGEFTLTSVTEQHLYSTAFLTLGLYFTLSSFAKVFNWLHYLTIYKSPDNSLYTEGAPPFYQVTDGLLTLIAGIALMLTARTWAAKLTREKYIPSDK